MLEDNAKPIITEQCEANSNENLKIKDYPSLLPNKDVEEEFEDNSTKPIAYEGYNINSEENLLELEIPKTQMLILSKSAQ